MEKEDYVLKHDFGYGREPEQKVLNKLELRNLEDLTLYINWSIRENFLAKIDDNNIICFYDDNSKVQVKIEKVN